MRFRQLVRRLLIAALNRSPLVRNVAADLEPYAELELAPQSSPYHLLAVGEDPQFVADNGLAVNGWYMVEVAVPTSAAGAWAQIYLDVGQGFSDGLSYVFPLKKGRMTKRLIRVPAGTRQIRFDPINCAGEFSLERVRFAWAPWRFARTRIYQRLVNLHPVYKNLSPDQVPGRLMELAAGTGSGDIDRLLEKHYEQTYAKTAAGIDYNDWLSARELISVSERREIIAGLTCQPLISVLMPVFNPRVEFLRKAIDSVIRQSYQNWELCIANDASTDPEVARVLDECAALDTRVRVVHRSENGHISATSNSALEIAEGEFIALLDHDDEIVPDALLRVAEALNANPAALLLYSDEDKIDEFGQRFDPHFKPDWNPELLLGQNYISHLGVYQAERVREVGAFREGFEGSQDHDLVLRFTKGLADEQIFHIPEVLYHWRSAEGSTAMDSGQKSYSTQAGLRAVADVFSDDAAVTVDVGPVPNTYRVRYPLPDPAPKVSLLVPTRDGVEILKPCVDAMLERTDYPNFEVLILDNQSICSETLRYMNSVAVDPRVRVLRWNFPFNYSSINNFGALHASGDLIGLINNDIEPINSDWLCEMVRHACRPGIGCVGAKLYYPNDTIQHAGVILGVGGVAGHAHKYFDRYADGYFSRLHLVQNMSAVTAACLLVRKSVYVEVGGLDEKNLAVAFNDVDLCLRVRDAGYRNLWTPYAEAYHHESVSRGADDTPEKRKRHNKEASYMKARWGDALLSDPAYNPNLTLIHEDFSLRPLEI
ncbi:glycosyltransferase family 2 protein [Marinobacter nauticus]|uniref:glycosyltransferase family 2 protein n=1 Tax=Marinobacter nauticus TaxID=2743 RepID=UPI001D18596E|nr:glycosyltransferase family 2 protein [Marinobacter nauticus]MCC4270463.1 glycosyltransferase family 2 protein [Marinobacter nauticus]